MSVCVCVSLVSMLIVTMRCLYMLCWSPLPLIQHTPLFPPFSLSPYLNVSRWCQRYRGGVWCCLGDQAGGCHLLPGIWHHMHAHRKKSRDTNAGHHNQVLPISILYFKWSHPSFFHSPSIHLLSPRILLFARCDFGCQKHHRLAEYCVCWENANTFLVDLTQGDI